MTCIKFAPGRGNKTKIEVWRNDELTLKLERNLGDERDIKNAASKLGLEYEEFLHAIGRYEKDGEAIYAQTPPQPICHFIVRDRTSPEILFDHSTTDIHTTFDAILNTPANACDPVITWDNIEALAIVDFDCVEGRPWTLDQLDAALLDFHPMPSWAWVTHGGGIRLIYETMPGITADKIAALAALHMMEYPHEECTIKSDTRHPASVHASGRVCSSIRRFTQNCDRRAIAPFVDRAMVSESEVAAWLGDNGYSIGEKYKTQ